MEPLWLLLSFMEHNHYASYAKTIGWRFRLIFMLKECRAVLSPRFVIPKHSEHFDDHRHG